MTYYDESPHQYAEQAAEAVRALNHATLYSDAYEWPCDVDRVIADLYLTLMRLEQALTQAGRWLTRAEAEGRIGHDQNRDPATAVRDATQRLAGIAGRSELLAIDLDAVRRITSHLTGTA